MTTDAPPLTPDGYAALIKACGATVEHPIYRLPTFAEFAELVPQPGWLERFVAALPERERAIRLMREDPLEHGHEPACWQDADAELARPGIVMQTNFGINRGGKSFRAAKRLCEAAMAYAHGLLLVVGETVTSSVETQQSLIWQLLEPHLGHLNTGKRSVATKIAFSAANGFTDNKAVLPTGTKLLFTTYNVDPGDYEGFEYGAPVDSAGVPHGGWKYRANGTRIENLGLWLDENATPGWAELAERRARFRQAKVLWTYTPTDGITPTIRDILGPSPQAVRTRPAELLPHARVPGCPVGHMPYIVKPARPGHTVIYFHLGDNPFHNYTQIVRDLCAGKSMEHIERLAYGYARNTISRAFPMFGPVHIVTPAQVPEVGTIYQYVDPHGSRNYFCIWVLVTPGDEPEYYIIRDWPDQPTYGDWAVTSKHAVSDSSRKGWDGDRGPAQTGQGWGPERYIESWKEQETVLSRCNLATENFTEEATARHLANLRRAAPGGAPSFDLEEALAIVRLPPHRRLLRQALERGEPLADVREPVAARFMDVRAGGTPATQKMGQKTPMEVYSELGLDFERASGKEIQGGLGLVQDLLNWNDSQPLVKRLNAPRLYVLNLCTQVIWALQNYTGRGAEDDGGKDPIDVIRHLAESAPTYLDPALPTATGGGSY